MLRYVIRRPRCPGGVALHNEAKRLHLLHAYKCNLTADSNAQTRPSSARITRFCAYQTPPPIFYRFEACLLARFGLGVSAGLTAYLPSPSLL